MTITEIQKYLEEQGIKMHNNDDCLFMFSNTMGGNQAGFKILINNGALVIICKTFVRFSADKDPKAIIKTLFDVNTNYRYYSFNINDTNEILLKYSVVADFVSSPELIMVMLAIGMEIVDSLVKKKYWHLSYKIRAGKNCWHRKK